MLDNVVQMLTQGVTFLGGVLIVFGLINLGMTIKDDMQGGGGQLAGAIAMIVGGAIVVGAAVYFGSLDTSWTGAAAMTVNTYTVAPMDSQLAVDASSFHLIA